MEPLRPEAVQLSIVAGGTSPGAEQQPRRPAADAVRTTRRLALMQDLARLGKGATVGSMIPDGTAPIMPATVDVDIGYFQDAGSTDRVHASPTDCAHGLQSCTHPSHNGSRSQRGHYNFCGRIDKDHRPARVAQPDRARRARPGFDPSRYPRQLEHCSSVHSDPATGWMEVDPRSTREDRVLIFLRHRIAGSRQQDRGRPTSQSAQRQDASAYWFEPHRAATSAYLKRRAADEKLDAYVRRDALGAGVHTDCDPQRDHRASCIEADREDTSESL